MPVKPTPAIERVLSRCTHTGDPEQCWVWSGATNKQGYGFVQLGRGIGTDRTHRVVYRALVGDIPDGMTLDHLCANTTCVNPAHLEPVTRAENTRRQWAAGRANAGVRQREKTHCKHGHEFTEANTYRYHGHRICRACRDERARQQRARQQRAQASG